MAAKEKTEFHNCDDQQEVDSFFNKVKAGDALEFRRTGFYHHWGICIGRNEAAEVEVVHVTAPEDTSTFMAGLAASGCGATETYGEALESIGKPFKEPLSFVIAKQNFMRVNNSIDDHIPPFAVNVMLERVNKTLKDGGWGSYHLALNNCEHYVNYCRNGNRVSLQSLEKGRQTLGYLATEAKKLADCPPSPKIGFVAAAAGSLFTFAQEFVANRERRFRGQPEVENNNGQKRLQD